MTPDRRESTDADWRFARAHDAAALAVLIRAAYRGEASRAGWTSEADLVDGDRTDADVVRALIGSPNSTMLVAFDEPGRVIACCQLEDRGDGLVYFGTFAVDPTRQAAGLGRWLLGEAERVSAQSFSAHTIEITVLTQQSALIAWYERRGFIRTGETRPFPAHPRYARPLREDLRFIVLRKELSVCPPS